MFGQKQPQSSHADPDLQDVGQATSVVKTAADAKAAAQGAYNSARERRDYAAAAAHLAAVKEVGVVAPSDVECRC